MEVLSLIIGVKNSTPGDLENLIKDIGLNTSLFNACQVNLHVMDLREEYATVSKFLKEQGLEDDNPFFSEFNIDPFGLSINFDITRKFKNMELLEPIIFTLARKVSEMLETETIVMF